MFQNPGRRLYALAVMAACGAILTACNDNPLTPTQPAPMTVKADAHGGGGIAGGPVAIIACGTTISAPGKYALKTDLSGCVNAIKVTSSNVTLNLGGHTVSGQGTSTGIGLDVVAANNVSIQNGTFTNFSGGVEFEGVTGSRMSGVTATGNNVGFYLNADFFSNPGQEPPSEGNAFYDNVFNHNLAHGIDSNGGNNNKFRGNQADYNGHSGYYLYTANGNDFKGNEALSNGYAGFDMIQFSFGNLIQANRALGNGTFDMATEHNNPTDNTWKANTFKTASRTFIH